MEGGWSSSSLWLVLRATINDLLLFKAHVDAVIVTGSLRQDICPTSCWISVIILFTITFGLWWKFWPKVREPVCTAASFGLLSLLLLIVGGLPVGAAYLLAKALIHFVHSFMKLEYVKSAITMIQLKVA